MTKSKGNYLHPFDLLDNCVGWLIRYFDGSVFD